MLDERLCLSGEPTDGMPSSSFSSASRACSALIASVLVSAVLFSFSGHALRAALSAGLSSLIVVHWWHDRNVATPEVCIAASDDELRSDSGTMVYASCDDAFRGDETARSESPSTIITAHAFIPEGSRADRQRLFLHDDAVEVLQQAPETSSHPRCSAPRGLHDDQQQGKSVRRTSDLVVEMSENDAVISLRWPRDCSTERFKVTYAAASKQLAVAARAFTLVHDLSRCRLLTIPWELVVGDASDIAKKGMVQRVCFILRVNRFLRRSLAPALNAFSPVKPARVFSDAETADAWARTPLPPGLACSAS